MKIKEAYKVRQIAGENLIVQQGQMHADMTKIISLNDTALLLWQQLQHHDFTVDDVAQILIDTYAIPQQQALADAQQWIDSLAQCHII